MIVYLGIDPINLYAKGWPQLAAFLNCEDNFAVYCRYGLVHCRLLVQLEGEIQKLEDYLNKLDEADKKSNANKWRRVAPTQAASRIP